MSIFVLYTIYSVFFPWLSMEVLGIFYGLFFCYVLWDAHVCLHLTFIRSAFGIDFLNWCTHCCSDSFDKDFIMIKQAICNCFSFISIYWVRDMNLKVSIFYLWYLLIYKVKLMKAICVCKTLPVIDIFGLFSCTGFLR